MAEVFVHVLDLLSRYLHIACTTILVGGTLFYEMVVYDNISGYKRRHGIPFKSRIDKQVRSIKVKMEPAFRA